MSAFGFILQPDVIEVTAPCMQVLFVALKRLTGLRARWRLPLGILGTTLSRIMAHAPVVWLGERITRRVSLRIACGLSSDFFAFGRAGLVVCGVSSAESALL